jgi:hypothetical protein
MFGWLRRNRTDIFPYHDGRRWRRADPVAVALKLDDLADRESMRLLFTRAMSRADQLRMMDPKLKNAIRAEREHSQQKLAEFARQAFDLPEFDAGGLTAGEGVELMIAFRVFCSWLIEDARYLADAVAIGMPMPPGKMTYAKWAGLWLSKHDILSARADAIGSAVASAMRE